MRGPEISRETIRKERFYRAWDCSSCGILGINANTTKQCPQCGNPREDEEVPYRTSTPVRADYEHPGADITCQHCGSVNQHRFSCHNCGAALDKKYATRVSGFTFTTGLTKVMPTVQVEQTGFAPQATLTPWNQPVVEVASPKPTTGSGVSNPGSLSRLRHEGQRVEIPTQTSTRSWWWILLVAAVALVTLGGWYVYHQINDITTTEATPTSVSWTYSLPLEDYAARDHTYETESSFWRPPSDAFNIRSYSVTVRHEPIFEEVWVSKTCTTTEDSSYNDTDGTWVSRTDRVTYDCSGYETQRVGSEPIPGRRWHWQRMEWARTTPLTASGDSFVVEFPVFIPTNTLRQAGTPTTSFDVTFSYLRKNGEQGVTTRTYPRAIWETVRLGEIYAGARNGFNQLVAVAGLDPEYDNLFTD